MALRQGLRGFKWLVSLLALALLLLIAAWLASNWNDAPPQPRPAALQLPSPTVPDEHNAYFALMGLHAAADREPSSAGQALWKLELARATKAGPQRWAAVEQPDPAIVAVLGTTLPALPHCDTVIADCVAASIDKPEGLLEQRRAHAVLGQRCERLLDGAFRFDEVLAPMRTVAEPLAQHGVNALNCSRWFLGGAVLAWTQQDPARAIAQFNRADRLNRALLGGSHSLIGQMIAVRATRNTFDTMTALAIRDARLAAALTPLIAPLPDAVQSARRWMVVEAAFSRGVISEVARVPEAAAAVDATPGFDVSVWLARHRIGWHPERTLQASDAQWLRSMQPLGGGLAAAIHALEGEAADTARDHTWNALTWVNPVGNVLVHIGRPAHAGYLARQADLDLHRETAALALHVASADVPPAQRRAWLAQQPRSALAAERIAFSGDGFVLGARTWQETSVPGIQPPARDAIRIAWPSPR